MADSLSAYIIWYLGLNTFDLVLSVVAVLIVPGGFKGGCLFIGPRFFTTLGRTRGSLTCVV